MSIQIENPIRFTFQITYIYLYIEELMFSLYLIFLNDSWIKYLERYIKKQSKIPNIQTLVIITSIRKVLF